MVIYSLQYPARHSLGVRHGIGVADVSIAERLYFPNALLGNNWLMIASSEVYYSLVSL